MVVNKQALVAAVAKFRDDTAKAVKFHDPERTNSANTRRKHTGVMEARAALLGAMPAEPTAPGVFPGYGRGGPHPAHR